MKRAARAAFHLLTLAGFTATVVVTICDDRDQMMSDMRAFKQAWLTRGSAK